MKVYFAAFVWGENYIKDFLALTLPTQFTKNNILAVDGKIKYVFYIKKNELLLFNVKIIEDLKLFCEVDFQFIDYITKKANKYNNLSLVQNRALLNAKKDAFDVFFPIYSDLLFSSNAIPYAIEKIENGKHLVFSMAPQVIRKSLALYLQSKSKGINQGVELDPVEMTKFVLSNLHPIRAPSVFRDGEFSSFPSVFFIDTPEGCIGKAFHLHPVALRITSDSVLTSKFIGTLDEHFIPLLVDKIEMTHVVENTADMCLCSFDEHDGTLPSIGHHPKLADRDLIVNIAERHASKIHRAFFEKNIYFNVIGAGNNISNNLRTELNEFTNSILRELLVSNEFLRSFYFERYIKRKALISLKKRQLEYQIKQNSPLIKVIILWKIKIFILNIINLLNLNSVAVDIRRKIFPKKLEFEYFNISLTKKTIFNSSTYINSIYGSELVKYMQGQSLLYLIYVTYIKYIRQNF